MESLTSLQRSGSRSIDESQTPRPGGVPQGSVLVVLDVNKDIESSALYWALGNVVRKGDNLKIVGIITYLMNPMGFKSRVDANSWIGAHGTQLQREIAVKRDALENFAHVKEWCEKAGVKLEIDVKAGHHPKLIAVDEAKAIGAYHVVLDKNMTKDRKYFIENLTCFVSRARNSGGVDTIRSFAMNKQLPPMVPTTPNQSQPIPSSKASISSAHSHRGSSMSSNSFELGGESSDEVYTQDSDQYSGPTTGDSMDRPELENGFKVTVPTRTTSDPLPGSVSDGSKAPVLEPEAGYKHINPIRKPALRKWLSEEVRMDVPYFEQGSVRDRGVNGVKGNNLLADVNDLHQRPSAPERLVLPVVGRLPFSQGRLSLHSRRQLHTAKVPSPPVSTLPSPPISRMPSPPASTSSQGLHKKVWVWTRSKEVMRTAVEREWTTFVFTPDTKHLAPEWTSIEWIKPLFLEGGQFLNQDGKQVALLGQVYSGEQLDYLPAMMGQAEVVVINDLDWQIIPPDHVVAAFKGRRTELFATANCANDAQVYLEALEIGTDGVVLHTDEASEVMALKAYMTERGATRDLPAPQAPVKELGCLRLTEGSVVSKVGSSPRSDTNLGDPTPKSDTNSLNWVGSSPRIPHSPGAPPLNEIRLVGATVKRVDSVGMGERVCVDLCNLLNPGECLLVGSFERALFMVHSEIQAGSGKRSFRVNAGPVHAYTSLGGGRTQYLSELESGSQVLVADAHGKTRTVLVGRVQIESKPLVLLVVEAEGESYSVMLENADSVRLIIPADMQGVGIQAIPVTHLQPGNTILLSMQDDLDQSYEK